MKKIIILTLALYLALNRLSAQSNTISYEKSLKKAEIVFNNKDYSSALSILDSIVVNKYRIDSAIESLYVKIFLAQGDDLNTLKHLNGYFRGVDENAEEYEIMLNHYINLKIVNEKEYFREGLLAIGISLKNGRKAGLLIKQVILLYHSNMFRLKTFTMG
ncbi:hypothetical protein [uncultured Tenacibaculum sp.]|uniref:hypothetical protein n=1 Tax=uncultured Tenacibaculum sp. TaxID=174713 RepID=UPI0026328782|nr:hypothetical protein [uncultured Tenacibaculum sp.]